MSGEDVMDSDANAISDLLIHLTCNREQSGLADRLISRLKPEDKLLYPQNDRK